MDKKEGILNNYWIDLLIKRKKEIEKREKLKKLLGLSF